MHLMLVLFTGIPGIIGSLSVGIFASLAINPNGVNGLLYGNPNSVDTSNRSWCCRSPWIRWHIYNNEGDKCVDWSQGLSKVEESGLDIEEHAERAYSDEDDLSKI